MCLRSSWACASALFSRSEASPVRLRSESSLRVGKCRSSSSTEINSCCREQRRVHLCPRKFALCGQTGPVKPRAYRPDRDVECKCDILVTEVGERVKEQRVLLAGAHCRQRTCSRASSAGRRLPRVPRPRRQHPGRLRCEHRREVDDARLVGGDEARSSRSHTATTGRSPSHGSSPAVKRRA